MKSIQQLVREDLEAREKLGQERYGTSLFPHNGRDALLDAYEEALDKTCYLKQALEERDPLLTLLAELRRAHPDMRLGQLIVNATRRPECGLGSLFYITDAELLTALRDFEAAQASPPPRNPSD